MVVINKKEVVKTGYGLMGMTWRQTPTPDDKAIPVMKAALNNNLNFWNAGEFYGTPERNSMHLLNAYFTKYPEDADKVVISIKGAADPASVHPTGDKQGVQRSIDQCLKVLDGKGFISIFQAARVDPKVPIEETVGYIAEYVKKGLIGGIGLSEVGVNSIRKAAEVHKISAVEVEFSMFSTEILENGVAATCAELGIPIVAYSPLGRGFLTGQLKSVDDLDEQDFRKTIPRFQPGNFEKNLELVAEVEKIANGKGVTTGQIALAWVRSYSGKQGLPQIIPIPGSTTESRTLENAKEITLDENDLAALNEAVKKCTVAGGRYGPGLDKLEFA